MNRERAYRDDAIVLHGRALGEADRIVRLYSRRHGKVDAVAKGVRRPKNPLAGRVEIGAEIDALLHRGRNLDVLVEARLLGAHWQHLLAPEAYAALSSVLELTDLFSEPGVPDEAIYELLRGTLAAMGGYRDPRAVLPRFSLRLLGHAGFAPELETCVACGRPLRGEPSFADIAGGGLTCTDCSRGRNDRREFAPEETDRFAALARPVGAAAVMRATPGIAATVTEFVRHQIGRRLRSESIE